ncbi:MAG: PilZ domain-containing protein [Planctomycetota bacterium]
MGRIDRLLLSLGLAPPLGLLFLELAQAQEGRAKEQLAELLRLRGSDPDLTRRYVIALCVGVALVILIWMAHRILLAGRRRFRGRTMRRRWDVALRQRGLDPTERRLVTEIAQRADASSPEAIVRSRVGFERGVERSLPLLEGDSTRQQTLEDVRRKLGWLHAPQGVPLVNSQLLDLNLEVEVYGTQEQAGVCVRAILVHRDPENIILRLDDDIEGGIWEQGNQVQVYFWRANDAGYIFNSEVRASRRIGALYLFLAHPPRLERLQRRFDLRVPHQEAFRYLHIPFRSASDWMGTGRFAGGDEPLPGGCTEDLSAGGFRLSTDRELEEGDYLSIAQFSPAGGEEVLARVVVDLGSSPGGARRYGVQYVGLPLPLRDTIARRVFALQRASIPHGPVSAGQPGASSISPTPQGDLPH